MNYLKFAGLSLLASVVFVLCTGAFVGSYLGPVLALVLTGAGFAHVKPAHFKVGYAVWIAVSFITYYGSLWVAEIRIHVESYDPLAGLAYMNYAVGWFLDCVVSNPICYWLGKRLAKLVLPVEAPLLAERSHDLRAS